MNIRDVRAVGTADTATGEVIGNLKASSLALVRPHGVFGYTAFHFGFSRLSATFNGYQSFSSFWSNFAMQGSNVFPTYARNSEATSAVQPLAIIFSAFYGFRAIRTS